MLDEIQDCLLVLLIVFVLLLMLFLFAFLGIQLKSSYIDVQLKEILLYSGDSYTQGVTVIG